MSLGRPAIRAKEIRTVNTRLAQHKAIMDYLTAEGINSGDASAIAYAIVSTTQRRKAIWRPK